MVSISNTTAVESEGFLVFDITLNEAVPFGQSSTLALEAKGITAREGPKADFKDKPKKKPKKNSKKEPFDFASEFEFSLDDGRTWQPADKGNQVTIGFGLTYLKVRLPINDDRVDEGMTPETVELRAAEVIRGKRKLGKISDTGIGSIIDDDGRPPVNVIISDTVVTEGKDEYAVFDVGLSSSSNQRTILQLEVAELTAKGGAKADFKDNIKSLKKILDKDELKELKKETKDQLKAIKKEDKLAAAIEKLDNKERKALEKALRKKNVDFADQEFEVSYDRGKTWQAAKKGKVEIPQGTIDLTQVRVPLSDDDFTETNEAFALQVTSVQEGQVDSISSVGTATIIDNDPVTTTSAFEKTLQAEDATLSGPIVFAGRDAEGSGYADYQNASGDFIEWTVNAPSSGSYQLSWRYQNGSSNRPLELAVNGGVIDSSLDFPFSGGWTSNDWTFISQAVNLDSGNNTIRLTANGKSGANFDYLNVVAAGSDVIISDAAVTEGPNAYLTFDISLSDPSNETITLDLVALDDTAQGGAVGDFDSAGNIDFANQAFEVSTNGGATWQAAAGAEGTEVTFSPGETDLKVRLAVNNDIADEGTIAETMRLAVNAIKAGFVRDATDRGQGAITDDDNAGSGTPPISLLPATDIRVDNDIAFTFDGQDGGHLDRDIDEIGFTMIDPASNPGNPNPTGGVVGYWPEKLDVTNGLLKITTTDGIQYKASNSQDNMLGIGLSLPSKKLGLETTLVDLPTAPGGYAQAGLWFGQATGGGDGTSEDDYIKFVAVSPTAGNYQIQAMMEQAGSPVRQTNADIPDDPASLKLQLLLDPQARSVSAFYSVSEGVNKKLTTFNNVPDEWFSFDQAGIDPSIATRSFGGIFATSRNAGAEQVFSFDDFSATEEVILEESTDLFDRWNLPVVNPTSIEVGPDGRVYVATLFGNIHVFTVYPETRTFEEEIITTIPDKEGANRLTLGLAIDPDSTAENVILWVSHSNGSVSDGALNSGKISRLSGPGFTQKEDVVTGLPRAIANHGTNDIDFGPDGRLYVYQGGNTGAGSGNNIPSEFKDRPEQPLSAAVLTVDIPSWKANPGSFEGDVSSPIVLSADGTYKISEFIDEFYARKELALGRPFTEVLVYASGTRNTYDGAFHSNGNLYAPDNGLGVKGTVPPVPRPDGNTDRSVTILFGKDSEDNPGSQIDPLNRIVEGGYYGHPNPYRDEVVFKDGSFQGFDNTDADTTNDIPPGHPEYIPPFLSLGKNKSANGIIEYTADNLFGDLKGDLLIANFTTNNVTRVKLTADGLAPVSSATLAGGYNNPLPMAMGPNGTDLEGLFFVGELNGGSVTVMESRGIWRNDLPDSPLAVLDAGSAVLNDQLYMVGGKTSTGHINDVYVYDPGDPFEVSDDIWSLAPSLPGTAVENPAVVAYDGAVYSFGGSTGPFSGAVNTAYEFNPASGWTPLPDMPTARGGAQAAVLDDKIYVIGGLGADGASLNTVEAFDPLTGSWITDPLADPAELQTRRDNPGVAVVNGQIHVFGGRTRNANGTTDNGALNTMEIYDPVTDSWMFGAPMLNGRRTMAVGTLNDRIQAIGGEGGAELDIHEEYNPATGAWRTLPDIITPRHGAAFGTINDVMYVAAGGPTVGSSFTNATEAFDF